MSEKFEKDRASRFPYIQSPDDKNSEPLLRERIWENWKTVLAKYDFKNSDGAGFAEIEDYRFVEVIEREDSYADGLGHPLVYCQEYRQLKADFCNASHLSNEPIHNFFGLSYATHLVLRRNVLQSAPLGWQRKFVELLAELEELFEPQYLDGTFVVLVRGESGKMERDGDADYERGRARIPLKTNL